MHLINTHTFSKSMYSVLPYERKNIISTRTNVGHAPTIVQQRRKFMWKILSRTNDLLSRTNEILSRTNDFLSRTNKKISRTDEILSCTNKIWYHKGLRYIHDSLNDDGSFLNYETFFGKFYFNPPILRFYWVRDAILKRWRILQNYNTKQFLPVFPLYIRIMMFHKKNKFSVYSKFINDLQYKQKYSDKWNTTLQKERKSKFEWPRMENDQ